MKTPPKIIILYWALITTVLFSCVSVQMPNGNTIHAPNVEFRAPSKPFKKISSDNTDKAWQSAETGNTIAFFSDCNPSSDNPLSSLAMESTSALTDLKTIESHDMLSFDGRDGLEILVTGKIDGVAANLWLLVFKKNGCNFTLSMMGSAKKFDAEKKYFVDFKNSFQVPAW